MADGGAEHRAEPERAEEQAELLGTAADQVARDQRHQRPGRASGQSEDERARDDGPQRRLVTHADQSFHDRTQHRDARLSARLAAVARRGAWPAVARAASRLARKAAEAPATATIAPPSAGPRVRATLKPNMLRLAAPASSLLGTTLPMLA